MIKPNLLLFSFALLNLLAIPRLNAQEIDYEKFGIEAESANSLTPLKVGEIAPDFAITKRKNLSDLYKKDKVVLVFYRGSWCPYCTRYLSELQKDLETLRKKGYQVVAVAPQKEQYIVDVKKDKSLEFPIVADLDLSIMSSYRVLFDVTQEYQDKVERYTKNKLSDMNVEDANVLPVPATYLIGKDGKIEFVHYDVNYSKRSSIMEILGEGN